MPVEIVQFCWKYNLQRLENLPEVKGCTAKLRKNDDDSPYVTDNSNYIVDLYFETPIQVCMQMAAPPWFACAPPYRWHVWNTNSGLVTLSGCTAYCWYLAADSQLDTVCDYPCRMQNQPQQLSPSLRASWTTACSSIWWMCASLRAAMESRSARSRDSGARLCSAGRSMLFWFVSVLVCRSKRYCC